MRRFAIRLLALTGLAGAVLAAPAAVSAREPGAPAVVELVAPRAGATLAAGATAEIEWAPLAPFAKLDGIEEWEAFLSLDGGATYPVRITPHLDQDLRRVTWQVPPVATTDARLLLRFGDERRETPVELPQRFAIAPSPAMALSQAAFLLAGPVPRLAPARGEPARPDQAGVVAWVEGSRRGGALRQVVAAGRPGFQTGVQPGERRDETAELAGGRSLPIPELREAQGPNPAGHRGSPLAGPRDVLPFAVDILLLIQRQNE